MKTSDVRDLVSGLPAVAHAVVDLYEAFRRRVSVLGSNVEAGEDASESGAAGLPSEEITEFLQRRLNHFPQLEEAAEALWVEHGLSLHTLHQDLIKLLSQRFAVDVEIAPSDRMRGELRRYNPLNRRLELSEMLALPSRTFQLAHQLAFLALRSEIEAIVSAGKFLTPEADALARSALANYFAAALLMPYGRFLAAARQTRYDINVLQHRFDVSFEQVCHRLTTLRRPGDEGVPFHLIRVDIAGNISKRFSASGHPYRALRRRLPALERLRRLRHARHAARASVEDAGGPGLFLPRPHDRPRGRVCRAAAACRIASANCRSGSAAPSNMRAISSIRTASTSTIRRSSRRSASRAAPARVTIAPIAPCRRSISGSRSTRIARGPSTYVRPVR